MTEIDATDVCPAQPTAVGPAATLLADQLQPVVVVVDLIVFDRIFVIYNSVSVTFQSKITDDVDDVTVDVKDAIVCPLDLTLEFTV